MPSWRWGTCSAFAGRDRSGDPGLDFAHAGQNVSVALPADLKIDVHGALESLEMGLLPISQFNGRAGAQYRNPLTGELRLDFVTSMTRDGAPVEMPDMNLALEPLKFMEFSLEQTVQGCVFSNLGACVVNLPAPERLAVHKLIVYGERPARERTESMKDLLQAASPASYFLENGQAEVFEFGLARCHRSAAKGWLTEVTQGRDALLRLAPDLAANELWAD